eukprot:m.24503 g.24503  ORF g.24503 m.24503 type:complete len:67 (+) comp6080_c0_seq1:3421-3621(+)
MNNSPIDTEHKQYIFILTGVQRFEVSGIHCPLKTRISSSWYLCAPKPNLSTFELPRYNQCDVDDGR